MNLINTVRTERQRAAQVDCTRRGYYLVKGDSRYWISESVDIDAMERVCDRVLNDKIGYDYWVDYSYGVDVDGRPAWSNVDQVDRFF